MYQYPSIAIIIPVLNEEESLRPLHEALIASLEDLGRTWEIVYVDDGSRDDSLTILEDLASEPTEPVWALSRAWKPLGLFLSGLAIALLCNNAWYHNTRFGYSAKVAR